MPETTPQLDSRRRFLGKMTGLAGATLAVPRGVLGANERIRFVIIGFGARGSEIVRQAMQCPGTEFVAAAVEYTRRLDEARALQPGVATYTDHRRLLEDHSIHAVLIATPQHLHCTHFVHALE